MNKQPDCFQLSLDEIRIKHTKDYETWLELSTEHYDSLEKEVEDNEN